MTLPTVLPDEAAPVADPSVLSAPVTDAPATPPEHDSGEGPAEAPAPTRLEALRALLDQVDPAELEEAARHPKVAGKIGAAADKLQRQRDADAKAQADRAEELEAARNGDLVRLGERKLQELQPTLDAEAELPVRQRTYGAVHASVEEFAHSLPPAVQQQLAGKTYEGTYEQGLVAYLGDVSRAMAAHELETRKPVLLKEWLGETRGAEDGVDLGTGTAAVGGRQYANWTAVSEALMRGDVDVEFARRYRAQHGER